MQVSLYPDRLASVPYDITKIQLPSGCYGGKAANTKEEIKDNALRIRNFASGGRFRTKRRVNNHF